MTRVAFPLRFGPGGRTLTEPWAPAGRETYYARPREWFTLCRLCGTVTAHACEVDAHRAATRTCPEPSCPPEQVQLCHHCGLRKVQRHVYRGQLCYRCSTNPTIRIGYMTRRPSRKAQK